MLVTAGKIVLFQKKLNQSMTSLKNRWKTVEDTNYFIPAGIIKDKFHSSQRIFIENQGRDNGFLVTEDKGASFEFISMKSHIDAAAKTIAKKKSNIKLDSFKLSSYYLKNIHTNSDYNNIIVNYFIKLKGKVSKQQGNHHFYFDVSFISRDKGKTFTFIDTTSDDYTTIACEFLDKEIGNEVSTSDLYCLQSSYGVSKASEFSYIERSNTQLVRSTDLGKTLEVIDVFQNLRITWINIAHPYIMVYALKDKYNNMGERDLYLSNDLGKSFKKAIIPTETNNKNQMNFINAFFKDDIVFVTKTSFLEKLDPESNRPLEKISENTYISDSTGFKFTSLDDVVDDLVPFDLGQGNNYIDRVSNFMGVFILQSTRSVIPSENSQNSYSQFGLIPGFISFDDGNTWDTFNVKNNDKFSCNPETSSDCYLRLDVNSNRIRFPQNDVSADDRLTRPGIASIHGDIRKTNSLGANFVEKNPMTFITRDFGRTWEMAFDHMVNLAYGDYGNIIVGVHGDPDVDGNFFQGFYYSLDQGQTWEEYELKQKKSKDDKLFWNDIKPLVSDGSGLQFIASGYKVSGTGFNTDHRYIIDFTDVFDKKKCESNDIETVTLNSRNCIDGKSYSYSKRKPDSKCLIRTEFKDLETTIDICECKEEDFECSFEFVKDKNGNCVLDKSLITESGVCLNDNPMVLELPVKTLKMNNKCKNSNKFNIEREKIDCGELGITRGDDKVIIHDKLEFDGKVTKYQYFNTWEKNSIFVRTDVGSLYISTDAGVSFKKFNRLEKGEKIVEVLFNKYFGKVAYILTSENNLFVTDNAGESFTKFSDAIPSDSIQLDFPLDFNAKDPRKIIYYGGRHCESIFDDDCHANAYISKDTGKTFSLLLENALHCEFLGSTLQNANYDLIVCEVKSKDKKYSTIVSSTDYFQNNKKVLYDGNSLGFASYKNFTVFAIVEDKNLRAFITMDGKEYAGVHLPKKFNDFNQKGFTVAGSTAGSIIMHLTTEMGSDKEYGALLKSNYNGTNFVTIESAVNRNGHGFIDFEYVGGLEGVFISNVVTNPGSSNKELKTKISFNDGGVFRYLTPPKKSFKGAEYECAGQNLEKCSLNLHGYTERKDIRDTMTSGAGVGLLIGIGNVGEKLLPIDKSATYLSVDGGINWEEISDKRYQYEFGDRGNLIVLASYEKTDSILYSKDQGKTWKTLKIANEPVLIHDLITNPTDASLNFVLICSDFVITVNFFSMYERQCSVDNENDFGYKAFQHPDSKCVFGHEMDYIYKKNEKCYVGMVPLENRYKITKNCACTRNDYECDYNYELSESGVCELVEGASPLDPSEVCAKNPNLIEVFHPTGYRKISLSTCEGGEILDQPSSLPQPCPGKEEEFKKLHKFLFGKSVFFSLLPIGLMVLTLWVVYDRGIRRNGGFSRFSEIRLCDDQDDDGIIEENFSDIVINRIVFVGVIVYFRVSNIYRKMSTQTGNKSRKMANVFGVRRQGFRNPEYYSAPTDNAYNTFDNDSLDDDLLFGNDGDANNLSALNNEDGNADVYDVNGVESFEPLLPRRDTGDTRD